ncbi:phosphoribosylformylglycinamidine synthase [Spiroplasma gladiatoris]|uniref:Phosphoribosylformylglycinamidine synthase n=1 Tax=Spiroplasma gladiatoris TaxID=2143 RepID=A0A4P7AIG5_9MOLU|nr:phosphoribosylformylglycinamidine synthase [Spiroplasma gladiatoris]QBQ08052.1 phosphoribosylformylglycinamidine synthase [Spiroplasma gladiatoris]
MNKRIYVSKKKEFDIESKNLINELEKVFNINIDFLKVFNVYDLCEVSEKEIDIIKNNILSEINIDDLFDEIDLNENKYFAIKTFDSQFNQREESASECSNLLLTKKIKIKTFKLFVFDKNVSEINLNKFKKYLINPIESYEVSLDNISKIDEKDKNYKVILNYDFNKSSEELKRLYEKLNLAMSFKDFTFIANYFSKELKRYATDSEIYLLDTYWSDHCRHKTFETIINKINFNKDINLFTKVYIEEALEFYKKISTKNNLTLMSIATSYGKYLVKNSLVNDIEVSDEINAASIIVDVNKSTCIVQFKNETHNHPTEVEPFGGASTCLGGAIRDPLSGRAYVYQGIRVTGAGDILESFENTIPNKLAQSKISKTAAEGFSSYGNQIGMPTTLVKEIYHNNYKAKRLEIGAVVGVSKLENLVRKKPEPGDIIVLVGGATGKDGIGGATGSSKNHDKNSMQNSYSEVQKGNPVEERKLQRLFSIPKVSKIIKKSNDLGAGGIGVGAGELADGVKLNLDNVHLKYKGLTGKEILISESQERMVVVIEQQNLNDFIESAQNENLIAIKIGEVIEEKKFEVTFNGDKIVDIKRNFIDTGGVTNKIEVNIDNQYLKSDIYQNKYESFEKMFLDLNVMSQKQMIEMFDFSIGSTTVLAPFGGVNQLSETQVSCQKIPIKENTDTCTIMSYGYNPYIFEKNIFLGSMLAIIESVTKVVAVGGDIKKVKLTLQEYFEKLNENKLKWGKPLVALLGALIAQKELEIPAIGGKDSMSGTYENLNVPPTLVSFALTTGNANKIISSDFKNINNNIYLLKLDYKYGYPDFKKLKLNFEYYSNLIEKELVQSAFAIQHAGIAEALAKMSFGNNLGFEINTELELYNPMYGSIIFETKQNLNYQDLIYLGKTSSQFIVNNKIINKQKCLENYLNPIRNLYYDGSKNYPQPLQTTIKEVTEKKKYYPDKINLVKVLIAIFPGTNCEYDIKKAFKRKNVDCEEFIFNNLNAEQLNKSINNLAKKIKESHIFVIPGGFSLGDEPDGSGKYIASVLKNGLIKKSLKEFLESKKLILGICNGFQALIKSGIFNSNELNPITKEDPSLIKNNVNRHIATYVNCKVVNNNSPWTQDLEKNQVNNIAVSHGEGRFVINETKYLELLKDNQIAFEYVDKKNNPNGSYYNVEGIVSKNGLVLGKMGHSERFGNNICKNIYGNKKQDIFSSALNYFFKTNEGEK